MSQQGFHSCSATTISDSLIPYIDHRYSRLQLCPFGLRVTLATGLLLVLRLEEPVSSARLKCLVWEGQVGLVNE